MTLVIDNGRIKQLGKTSDVRLPAGSVVVPAAGKYLVPGLWDMHTHAFDSDAADLYLQLLVANGITGVREMGGARQSAVSRLRGWFGGGSRVGRVEPRFVAAGALINGPGGVATNAIVIGTAAEARAAVAKVKSSERSFAKVYNLIPREAYLALMKESKIRGLTVAGHVPYALGVGEAADAGQKSAEHLTGMILSCSESEAELRSELVRRAWTRDSTVPPRLGENRIYARALDSFSDTKCADLLTRIASNHMWQTPTLAYLRANAFSDSTELIADPNLRFMPRTIREAWDPTRQPRRRAHSVRDIEREKAVYAKQLELVGAINRAGIGILAGTDMPGFLMIPGFSLHDELELLVTAGLSPMQALQAATRNPASYFGGLDSLGTIDVGKVADLVLLDGNPLEDISNTRRVRAVVLRGRLLSRQELDRLLAEIETKALRM